jgi:hypothetical protein
MARRFLRTEGNRMRDLRRSKQCRHTHDRDRSALDRLLGQQDEQAKVVLILRAQVVPGMEESLLLQCPIEQAKGALIPPHTESDGTPLKTRCAAPIGPFVDGRRSHRLGDAASHQPSGVRSR